MRRSLLGGIGRGVVAGIAGTAAMTAYQLAVARARGRPLATPVPHRWADAPAPARVAKRLADALGYGRRFTRRDVPLLTSVVHWGTGAAWGAIYGAAGAPAALGGAVFGSTVWAASYAELVPLGVYEPPWRYPVRELAFDLSYHLVYGCAVAAAYAALD